MTTLYYAKLAEVTVILRQPLNKLIVKLIYNTLNYSFEK